VLALQPDHEDAVRWRTTLTAHASQRRENPG
jgi:hypothetical protein